MSNLGFRTFLLKEFNNLENATSPSLSKYLSINISFIISFSYYIFILHFCSLLYPDSYVGYMHILKNKMTRHLFEKTAVFSYSNLSKLLAQSLKIKVFSPTITMWSVFWAHSKTVFSVSMHFHTISLVVVCSY